MSTTRQHLQPPKLFKTQQHGFSQVVVTPPGPMVFVSGQVAWDLELNLVGGTDIAAQAHQALENLRHALETAGAAIADITSVRVYIVDFKPEYFAALSPEFKQFFAGVSPPASTWIGVQALAGPGLMIEIEAQAVIAGE